MSMVKKFKRIPLQIPCRDLYAIEEKSRKNPCTSGIYFLQRPCPCGESRQVRLRIERDEVRYILCHCGLKIYRLESQTGEEFIEAWESGTLEQDQKDWWEDISD